MLLIVKKMIVKKEKMVTVKKGKKSHINEGLLIAIDL